jgi:hypothetical protein
MRSEITDTSSCLARDFFLDFQRLWLDLNLSVMDTPIQDYSLWLSPVNEGKNGSKGQCVLDPRNWPVSNRHSPSLIAKLAKFKI